MPPLSTHVRFASLLMPPLNIASHAGAFLLGTTAPDAFEPDNEVSFSQHHFKGPDDRIALGLFAVATNFTQSRSLSPSWAFAAGYYSHLWLDVFFRDYGDELPISRGSTVADDVLRAALRREAEQLNAPFVLRCQSLVIPLPRQIPLPRGLEFVVIHRCTSLFLQVCTQAETASILITQLTFLEEATYSAFLSQAATMLTCELSTAA